MDNCENNKWVCAMDLETTGFPERYEDENGYKKYYKSSMYDKYDKSRVVQMTFIFYNKETKEEHILDHIIKPDGYKIYNSHIHGISEKRAELEGVHLKYAIKKLDEYIKKYNPNLIIGHNIYFDIFVLQAELYRMGGQSHLKNFIFETEKYDTMKNGKNLNNNKCPKLDVLYQILFNEEREEEQKHNSLYDTQHTLKCYLKLNEL